MLEDGKNETVFVLDKHSNGATKLSVDFFETPPLSWDDVAIRYSLDTYITVLLSALNNTILQESSLAKLLGFSM